MANQKKSAPFVRRYLTLLVLVLPVIISFNLCFVPVAEAAQRSVHISDDLDDVVDDEEDEAWRQWGQRSTPPAPLPDLPPDFSNIDMAKMEEEMLSRQVAPTFGVVKLRPGFRRTRDAVTEIATKWSKVLKTGAVDVNFMGIDLNTIMFTLMRGQDTIEVREFLLEQPDAYEIKIGERLYRRPGDPPREELVKLLQKEKADSSKGNKLPKEEL